MDLRTPTVSRGTILLWGLFAQATPCSKLEAFLHILRHGFVVEPFLTHLKEKI